MHKRRKGLGSLIRQKSFAATGKFKRAEAVDIGHILWPGAETKH